MAPLAPLLAWRSSCSAGGTSLLETRPQPTGLLALATLLVAAVTYLCLEQLQWRLSRLRGDGKVVAGPALPLPFLGGLVGMVRDPFAFWNQQIEYSFPGFSCNRLLGKFMVFTTDSALSRKVLSYNDPSTLLMAVHPSGKAILGPNNLAFMHGPEHKAIRKSFLSLFTRKALHTYIQLQDEVIRQHLAAWLATPGEREFQPLLRDMNALTSQRVFCGPYVGGQPAARQLARALIDMTAGFLAFPLCVPGTAVWRGRQGRLRAVSMLKQAAARSKAHVQAGGEPVCLLDFWAARCLDEMADAAAAGGPPPRHTSDWAMADTVMDFLFASQDASTASLAWSLCLLADHPDVLAKVRAEQRALRPDLTARLDGEAVAAMTYTRQVVKEILRFRPPAPMVPQVAQKPFQLTADYTVPRGALVMPSITASSMQGYTDPDKFDPDRFSPERKEDLKHAQNYLVFGHGPHACVGREYAINHLICFVAIMSTSCVWGRRRTPQSDSWRYLPTVTPGDCLISLRPLEAAA